MRIQVKLPSYFVVGGLLYPVRPLFILVFVCLYACVFVAF